MQKQKRKGGHGLTAKPTLCFSSRASTYLRFFPNVYPLLKRIFANIGGGW